MNSVEKVQNEGRKKNLVLAPGAADISEGAVYLDAETPLVAKHVAADSFSGAKPAGGFCSIAPGCGDVSEGMVWVPGKDHALRQHADQDLPHERMISAAI